MITIEEITPIGKFHKTHALKGELNAVLDIDAEFLDTEHPLIVNVDGIFVPFYCESVRPKGHFASLVKIQGIDSEDKARDFVNKEIYALKTDVDDFIGEEENEDREGAYADDFIGFHIIDANTGKEIGEITELELSTANPLFIVNGDDGKVFIPIADEFFSSVDAENKVIVMDLPEGLADINTSS